MMIAFMYCTIRMMFAKQKKANFVRFDKVNDGKMQVAYYSVEGEEYPCIFPKEFVFPEAVPLKEQYKQCGNTVCVLIIFKIIQTLNQL